MPFDQQNVSILAPSTDKILQLKITKEILNQPLSMLYLEIIFCHFVQCVSSVGRLSLKELPIRGIILIPFCALHSFKPSEGLD